MTNPFDEQANHFDSDQQLYLANKYLKAISQSLGDQHFDTLLDYGGGTGNLGLNLLDYADQVVIADISQPMLEKAQEKIHARQLKKAQTLLLTEEPDLNLNYDLLILSMVLHHVDQDIDLLYKLVDPIPAGGRLIIIDFYHDPQNPDKKGYHPEDLILQMETKHLQLDQLQTVAKGEVLFMRPTGSCFMIAFTKSL